MYCICAKIKRIKLYSDTVLHSKLVNVRVELARGLVVSHRLYLGGADISGVHSRKKTILAAR